MKYFIIGVILISAALHYRATETSSPTQYPHKEIKILDGDTFILNWEHIRLIGINAPEIRHADERADCWAYQSMSQLEHYLTRIRSVSFLQIQRHGFDKYNRTLATVTIEWDKLSINERMVRDWYAESFAPKDGIPAPDYTSQNKDAINNLLGNYSHCVWN